jgi:hypothetical protein
MMKLLLDMKLNNNSKINVRKLRAKSKKINFVTGQVVTYSSEDYPEDILPVKIIAIDTEWIWVRAMIPSPWAIGFFAKRSELRI